jgi:hypothetical protein
MQVKESGDALRHASQRLRSTSKVLGIVSLTTVLWQSSAAAAEPQLTQ